MLSDLEKRDPGAVWGGWWLWEPPPGREREEEVVIKKPAFVDDEVARELAERMGLDPKGRSDDPFKAAVEKVVPLRVTSEITPAGRVQTVVPNIRDDQLKREIENENSRRPRGRKK
jgi:hypothetical protein